MMIFAALEFRRSSVAVFLPVISTASTRCGRGPLGGVGAALGASLGASAGVGGGDAGGVCAMALATGNRMQAMANDKARGLEKNMRRFDRDSEKALGFGVVGCTSNAAILSSLRRSNPGSLLVRRAENQRDRNGRCGEVIGPLNYLEKYGGLIKGNAHHVADLRHRHTLIRVGGERELGAVDELLCCGREGEF